MIYALLDRHSANDASARGVAQLDPHLCISISIRNRSSPNLCSYSKFSLRRHHAVRAVWWVMGGNTAFWFDAPSSRWQDGTCFGWPVPVWTRLVRVVEVECKSNDLIALGRYKHEAGGRNFLSHDNKHYLGLAPKVICCCGFPVINALACFGLLLSPTLFVQVSSFTFQHIHSTVTQILLSTKPPRTLHNSQVASSKHLTLSTMGAVVSCVSQFPPLISHPARTKSPSTILPIHRYTQTHWNGYNTPPHKSHKPSLKRPNPYPLTSII